MTTRRAFLGATTGRGGAEIETVGSHPVVESMRGGRHPRDEEGRPEFKVNHCAVNKEGEWAGAASWAGARFAVSEDGESRLEDSAYPCERS
jgi:hypothetical protein